MTGVSRHGRVTATARGVALMGALMAVLLGAEPAFEGSSHLLAVRARAPRRTPGKSRQPRSGTVTVGARELECYLATSRNNRPTHLYGLSEEGFEGAQASPNSALVSRLGLARLLHDAPTGAR